MSQTETYPYATHLDIRYPPLEVVDLPELVATCTDRWYNQTLCQVNGSVVPATREPVRIDHPRPRQNEPFE